MGGENTCFLPCFLIPFPTRNRTNHKICVFGTSELES